ncbi:MAG: hypothetical protein V1916_00240 [Patescibacteria group bacterium]
MPQKYLPKIKADTAKTMAKNLLATGGGKKISDTKFKDFLKKDQHLRQYSYDSKTKSYTKSEATKFFGKVTDAAKQNGGVKLNMQAARKMGLRVTSQGAISSLGLNRIYQQATTQELSAQQSTGPSPEEVRRQQRHDRAIKTMHQRERAEEMKKTTPQPEQQKTSTPKGAAPPPRAAGVSGGVPAQQQPNTQLGTAPVAPAGSRPATAKQTMPTVLVTPITNMTPHVTSLNPLAQKLSGQLTQTLRQLGPFRVLSQPVGTGHTTYTTGSEHDTQHAARAAGAQLYTLGSIRAAGETINITIQMVNVETGDRLDLVSLSEATPDIFELERKISWNITNSLQGESAGPASSIPSPNQAIDLPI